LVASSGLGNSLKKFTAPSKNKGQTVPPPPSLPPSISKNLILSLKIVVS